MANDNSNRIEGIGPEDYEVVYFAPELLQYANDRQKEAKDEFQTTLELAEEGDPQAMVQMGLNYLYGNIGIEKNDKKAFEWFSRVPEDSGPGRYWLGLCYAAAIGVPRDFKRAAELYRQSADLEYAPGQCYLGMCYEIGNGVQQDLVYAAELYEQAADAGYPLAMLNLGLMYYRGVGVPLSLERAAELTCLEFAMNSATASHRIWTAPASSMKRRRRAVTRRACAPMACCI